jgi:hypothetical protein
MKLHLRIYFLLIACLLTAACSRQNQIAVSWEQLIRDFYNPESIADISLACTEIHTSYDRTGGNDDFNHGFKRVGNGWLELVDLKGPGVMTRFWFTGIKRESLIQFVFDDEPAPRLKTTCDAFYEGKAGFPDSFVSTDQNCFYSGFPVPYQKSLRILVSDDGYSRGQGKLFFQINAVPLKNKIVTSSQFPIPETVRSVADSTSERLKDLSRPEQPLQQEKFQTS